MLLITYFCRRLYMHTLLFVARICSICIGHNYMYRERHTGAYLFFWLRSTDPIGLMLSTIRSIHQWMGGWMDSI